MIGRLWTLSDITEQKQAERLLEEFEEELQNAHELAKMGEWSFDLDSQEILFSDNLLALLKLPQSYRRFTFADFLELVNDDEQQVLKKQFKHCQKYGTSIQSELHFAIEGQEFYVILRGRFKVGGVHSKDAIQGVLQDISDLRTSEHLVKISSHFFQSSMQGNVLMGRHKEILDFNDVA